jgi:hypothetical protein
VVTLVLAIALTCLAAAPERMWTCGLLLCGVGLVGAIALVKHGNRYELHLSVMRAFRATLGETVRADILRITAIMGQKHNRRFSPLRYISLRAIWLLGCLGTIGYGAELAWRAFDLEAAKHDVVIHSAPPAAKLDIPLAPGAELP